MQEGGIDVLHEVCRVRLVTMETGDGWLIIAKTIATDSVVPPYRYAYMHEYRADLRDAEALYAEIEAGEWSGWDPVGIVACKGGVPPLDPKSIAELLPLVPGWAVEQGRLPDDGAHRTRIPGHPLEIELGIGLVDDGPPATPDDPSRRQGDHAARNSAGTSKSSEAAASRTASAQERSRQPR